MVHIDRIVFDRRIYALVGTNEPQPVGCFVPRGRIYYQAETRIAPQYPTRGRFKEDEDAQTIESCNEDFSQWRPHFQSFLQGVSRNLPNVFAATP
jgi:hypothetical protein